jgi:hypothetical protein
MQVDYYTKYGCSLCDEGLSILSGFPEIDVRTINIEEDIEKYHDYLLRIPVISYENGDKELAWPFTDEDIRKILSSAGA